MRTCRTWFVLFILAVFIWGCDNGDSGNADSGLNTGSGSGSLLDGGDLPDGTTVQDTCTTKGVVVDILDNHHFTGGDHELVIPIADIVEGTTKTYDIRGDNTGHTHTVEITADDFSLLQDGIPIQVTSSNNGSSGNSHTHDIIISCA